jgi:hypothetical protein
MLESNPKKIDLVWLSYNPNAIHMLEANPKKINWNTLSANPNIFEIDTKQLYIDSRKKASNIDFYL